MIAQFSLRLICGMSLMWCLMPRSRVTSGFFRIQMLVTLGLSVLAALTLGEFDGDGAVNRRVFSHSVDLTLCILLAVYSFIGSVMWTLDRRRAGTLFAFGTAMFSAGALLFSGITFEQLNSSGGILLMVSELTSAGLLGAAMTGMLLGHWYLTAPSMSIAPLSRLNLYFGVAGVLRLIVSGIGLYLSYSAITENIYWLWLLLRWSAGVVGPLIAAVMVWRILKFRNTQSATGVLFVGVILTFIGEMTALLLYRQLGVAL